MKAWGRGVVDSVSMIPCCKATKEAVKMAKIHTVDVGLHLFTTYTYRTFLKEYLLFRLYNKKMLYNLWDIQFKQFLDTGLELERVDSHHGIHFFPACWEVLMQLMKKYNVRYVRNPPRKFCWLHYNPKLWLGKNKSWLFYHINYNEAQPLPYKEIIWHYK